MKIIGEELRGQLGTSRGNLKKQKIRRK